MNELKIGKLIRGTDGANYLWSLTEAGKVAKKNKVKGPKNKRKKVKPPKKDKKDK